MPAFSVCRSSNHSLNASRLGNVVRTCRLADAWKVSRRPIPELVSRYLRSTLWQPPRSKAAVVKASLCTNAAAMVGTTAIAMLGIAIHGLSSIPAATPAPYPTKRQIISISKRAEFW
jgi:hypothetical protein